MSQGDGVTVLAVCEVVIRPDATDTQLAQYAQYRAQVAGLIARAGGRYLARAAVGTLLEGATDTADRRRHVVEFPDADAARAFWSSAEYAALRPLREGAADVRAVLLDA